MVGDSRASIQINFSIYGEDYKTDMWINYSGQDGEVRGVDDRVIAWFQECYNKAFDKWVEDVADYHSEQRKKDEEIAERKEFARLCAKYAIEPENKV